MIIHNLNRRADSLCASLCASPLPRPKAPRCVPLSLRPRAAASCASFCVSLRVPRAPPLRVLLFARFASCTNALVAAVCALSQRLPTPPFAPLQLCCTRAFPALCGAPAASLRVASRLPNVDPSSVADARARAGVISLVAVYCRRDRHCFVLPLLISARWNGRILWRRCIAIRNILVLYSSDRRCGQRVVVCHRVA